MMGLRGRISWSELPIWAAVVWCLVVLLRAHLFFLSPPTVMHALDEGYINALAWRMTEGDMLPFVDGVSHRGPLLYWSVAVAQWFGSPTSWVPIRLVSMLCGLATTAFTFAAAWRAGRSLAGGIAALAVVVAFLLGMGTADGIAYNGEHLLNAFVMAGLLCLVVALEPARPSPLLVGLAGCLVALGALSKQVGAISIAPLGLWVVCAAASRPALDRRARLLLPAAFAAGVALPVAVTLARYAAAGEVKTLFYYTVTYNADVYLSPYSPRVKAALVRSWIVDKGVLLGILSAIAMWGFTRPLASSRGLRDLPRAYDEHGFVATVALGSLSVVAASNAALRDFPHYYIQVVPWCGLLLGLVVQHAVESNPRRVVRLPGGLRAAVVHALILAPIAFVLAIGVDRRFETYARDRERKRAYTTLRDSSLCRYVRAHSRPDEALFVWGFLPELYTSCERKPASRYVFTTFVAGYVPWFDRATPRQDERRAVPGSRELLISDLESSRPPIIVDAPNSMGKRDMRRIGALARYLDEHYCRAGKKGGHLIHRRRTERGRCPKGSE
jgi:4-amino-4-deoxy-L-arabinose transferase-like glycosyltransferase